MRIKAKKDINIIINENIEMKLDSGSVVNFFYSPPPLIQDYPLYIKEVLVNVQEKSYKFSIGEISLHAFVQSDCSFYEYQQGKWVDFKGEIFKYGTQ